MGQALYYITLGCCAGGCILRILLAGYYRMLLGALKNMKSTRSRWMHRLKEKFILRYQAMLGVQNVESFVGRFMAEQRFLLVPLRTWNSLHMQLVSVCLLAGAVDALYRCIQMETTEMVLMAMFQGIWTSALLLVIDGFCMVQGKVDALKEGMCDYLENYLKVCLEHEYEVWGKNREELRQTKAVLSAQLQVVDERSYRKELRAAKKEQKKPKRRVEKDIMILKREVEERRRLAAEAAAAELERATGSQVEELLRELSLEG